MSVTQLPPRTPNILKAFCNFTSITGDTADALYSLRCCLAHDFGLINKEKRTGHTERNHIFMLRPDSTVLVNLPAERWDGVSFDRVVQHRTEVGLMALGQMAEAAAESVLQAHQDGDLALADGLTADEMNVRFNFQMRL